MAFKGALLKPGEKGERRTTASRSIAKGSRYEVLKERIRRWWDDRLKIGEALREIQASKLYKDEYGTFEEFCDQEFGLKHSQAYRLIEAADVKDSLKSSPMGEKIVNERQARALAPVPAEQREEVITKASASGSVTAKAITEAAKTTTPDPAPPSKPEKIVHLDKTGYRIPEDIYPDWQEAEAFNSILSQLHRIKLQIEKSVEESELAFREITNSTVSELENVWRDLQRVLPYAVCPTCQGRTREKCTLCKQRGWVSRFGYEHWVPKATRDLRERAIQK